MATFGPYHACMAHLFIGQASAGSRRALWPIFALLTILSSACGEDDEDRIETFVEAVTGEVTSERVDHVLATYLDLEQRPLSTTVLGDMRLYRAEDESRLKEVVRSRLQRMFGSSLKTLRRQIDIKGEKARVDLQVFGDGMMGNVSYELVKRDERWLIVAIRVSR